MTLSTKTHAKKTLSIMTLGTTFVTMKLAVMTCAFQPALLSATEFSKITLSVMLNVTVALTHYDPC